MAQQWTSPGDYRKRLTFQSNAGTQDSSGQPTNTWTTYYTCWGAIGIHHGAMVYDPGQFASQSFYLISCRYPGSSVVINPQDIITCEGETYLIQVVMDIEKKHRELQILAYSIDQPEGGDKA